MANPFYQRDVISIKDFTRQELEYLFLTADKIQSLSVTDRKKAGRDRTVALLFFEPSTRTRLSFEVAMHFIGGDTVGFSEPGAASVEKGENLADTIRTVEGYVDALIVRYPLEGAARFAAEITSKPLINAGSGGEEHPTQAMLDLYTLIKEKGKVDGLNIAVVGDLKYGRTVHSLLYGLAKYSPNIWLASPPQLRIRREVLFDIEDQLKISEHEKLEEIISDLDVIYATRIQKERFPDPAEYEKVKGSYVIDNNLLKRGRRDLIVMHPLPRVDEIKAEVDQTHHAKYFIQAHWGKTLRASLLALILNKSLP